jgi:hypothetical protein
MAVHTRMPVSTVLPPLPPPPVPPTCVSMSLNRAQKNVSVLGIADRIFLLF